MGLENWNFAILIVNILITAINVQLLVVVIKLYTEYFKDMSAKNRHVGKGENV